MAFKDFKDNTLYEFGVFIDFLRSFLTKVKVLIEYQSGHSRQNMDENEIWQALIYLFSQIGNRRQADHFWGLKTPLVNDRI